MRDRGLGRDFARLWASYAVSAVGTAVATDSFRLMAVLVLASSTLEVSLLSALGSAVGALLALPLGPWVEYRYKRPVMVGADLVRCLALFSIPAAYALGVLSYLQLALVSVVVAVGQILFVGASGSHLKALVGPANLTAANGRFEGVLWTSTAVGPPVGGLLMSVVGPAVTVLVDAVSFLLSALGIRSIRTAEPAPPVHVDGEGTVRRITQGWRTIFGDRMLALLFVNTVGVGSLIIAIAPVLTVLMLRELHFSLFEYGLSVGIPCLAGVVGARLSRRLIRHGQRRVLLGAGVARVLWLAWIPFVGSGWLGLVTITAIHTGTVFFMSIFNPVMATYRIERPPGDTLARVLTAWSISNNLGRAVCTVLWGVLATLTSPRIALGIGAALLLASCACLPWSKRHSQTQVVHVQETRV